MRIQSTLYATRIASCSHTLGAPPWQTGPLPGSRRTSGVRALLILILLSAGACGDSAPTEADAAPTPQMQWTETLPADELGWLMNVWGTEASNLYAVGGEPTKGMIMRFDGQSWGQVELGMDVPLLNWTHGFGPNDITIVGNRGTVIHWDGTAWTLQSTPTEEDLWGVWGASPDDLWAVGGRGREAGQATILHYDGSDWTEIELAPLERARVYAFFKVWGTSADNVYVVGQRGVVLHYDGTSWVEQGAGTGEDLISLWGTGPDRIVAVGGRGSGVAAVWDGQRWTSQQLAPLPGLNGVWMDEDGTTYAVGVGGTNIILDVETFEYESFPVITEPNFDFHSVFSADGKDIVAVGGNLLYAQGPYRGAAYSATVPEKE